ncbi:hypothetical protein PSA01_65870 [Pseudonocardia saturnea]|uniref:Uncharacterized protein n=1 Tax=Pseudonocardia saturnea TaxID=33909 RepID=A0ABQ0S9G1_9PSEU|nr:hypothetical protein PSA01_65870 [Pseudonocardia saturnea]
MRAARGVPGQWNPRRTRGRTGAGIARPWFDVEAALLGLGVEAALLGLRVEAVLPGLGVGAAALPTSGVEVALPRHGDRGAR